MVTEHLLGRNPKTYSGDLFSITIVSEIPEYFRLYRTDCFWQWSKGFCFQQCLCLASGKAGQGGWTPLEKSVHSFLSL